MPLILASQSASRRALLTQAGVVFQSQVSHVDEATLKAALPPDGPLVAQTLAEQKARAVARTFQDALVIGADQVLACGETLYDKPKTPNEALDRLRFFQGRVHTLETAVTCVQNDTILWRHHETARLKVRPFTEAFLKAYAQSAQDILTQTVGGYALEGMGIQLFEEVTGDYFAILGLPLLPLLAFLREHGALQG